MKFFLLLTGLLVFTYASDLNCGQGRIKNWINICIEPQYIPACQIYISETQCHKCQMNYEVVQGRCVPEDDNSPPMKMFGCLQYDQKFRCLNCANGFKNVNQKCQVGVKNCQKYNQDGTCSECKTTFSLLMNECKHNLLLGCKVENSDRSCKECWKPFYLNDKHCDVKNCMSLNDYGCVSCQCGFYLTQDKQCKQIKNGCMRYKRGNCINCLPHYQLKNGNCQIQGCQEYNKNTCEKCKSNFQNSEEGGCQIKNCFDWNNQKCIVCDEEYSLSDGGCVKSPQLQCQ